MARRKRGGRKDPIRRTLKRAASWIGSGVMIAGASHGLISTAMDSGVRSNPSAAPSALVFYYTGYDARPGQSGGINWAQTGTSLGIILGSIVAGKIIKYAGRSI